MFTMTTSRSLRLARAAFAFLLTLKLGACGVAPEEDGAAPVQVDAPVASQPSALSGQDCLRAFNSCNARCDRLAQQGQDASICYSDCSAQYYNCMCRVSPFTCFQG